MDHFHDGKYKNNKEKPHDVDIMDSRYRYSYVSLALNTSQTPTVERLYKIMCMPPCYSRMITIYTSIMIPYISHIQQ